VDQTDDQVDIAALGLDIGVTIDDDNLRDLVRGLWADCAGRTSSNGRLAIRVEGRKPWQVTSEAHSEHATNLPAAVGAVCAAVNLTVATQTPLLAVHAAVLSKSGTTIVVPGESGAGKTTLTIALLQAGWAYASDEAFALDWDAATSRAYPRPLGASDWTAGELSAPAGVRGVGERFLRASDHGASVAGDGYHVDHVLLLDRSAPVEHPVAANIHRAEALEVLVRQCFTHYRDPERAIRLLADVVRGAQTWRLRYGDPALAARYLGTALTNEDHRFSDQSIPDCDHRAASPHETIGGDGKRAGAGANRCSRSRGALDVAEETA
jgi:hypothetical protein